MPKQQCQDVVDDRTLGDKVADKITAWGGSWKAIFTGVFILTAWISYNHFSGHPFDPSLILLNLFLSMVAAFQAPFIMMSQNRTEKKQDEAYRTLFAEIKRLVQIDIKLEKEILKVLKEQQQQNGTPPA